MEVAMTWPSGPRIQAERSTQRKETLDIPSYDAHNGVRGRNMAYLDSRIEPPLEPAPTPQTFADQNDRDRLSPIAIKAYRSAVELWGVPSPEAAALLGVSQSTWERMRRGGRPERLSQDQLTRASAIIGIFKGLRLLFADDMSDRWARLPNAGPIFANDSPVAAMVKGGIPRMLEVRRYVDAVRGGI